MKNTFKEYYRYSHEDLNKMRENALFVIDANILLNFYRYSSETKDAFINILKILKDKQQLWLPYQVWKEFYKNRFWVITTYQKSYDQISKTISEYFDKLKSDLNKYTDKHPSIDLELLLKPLDEQINNIKEEIERRKGNHPNLMQEDNILTEITNLFDGIVWEPFDEKQIKTIQKEGEIRYEKKIPPWFNDKKKDDITEKYGDLILWKEIINKAKNIKKDIIFISDDQKDDRWRKIEWKNIMPLPELKKEIFNEASTWFHILTWKMFLEQAQSRLNQLSISNKIIDEVKNIWEDKLSEINYIKILTELRTLSWDIINNIRQLSLTEKHKELLNILDELNRILGDLAQDEGEWNINQLWFYKNLLEHTTEWTGIYLWNIKWLPDLLRKLKQFKMYGETNKI